MSSDLQVQSAQGMMCIGGPGISFILMMMFQPFGLLQDQQSC